MIAKPIHTIIQTFAGLPRPHRFGAIALTGILGVMALPEEQPSEGSEQQASHTSFIPSAQAATVPAPFLPPQSPAQEKSLMGELPEQSAIKTLEATLETLAEQTPVDTNTYKSIVVKKGDTLSATFKRAGVEAKYMYHLIHGHKKAKSLAKIFPGHELEFVINEEGKLAELHHIKNPLNKQVFTRTAQGYEHETLVRAPDIKLVTTSGVITQSLYNAAKAAELEDSLTMQFAEIFGWDVDFALDIRENDSFKVVYEEEYLDGNLLGTGEIIAAEFVNRGERIQAVRYIDSNGDTQYYTPEGRNMRKAFLRAPVDFRRISSSFNPKRLHPVTKKVRPHRGIDYAAKTGTPVWSPGDGKVIKAGYSKYNGNYIVIQHSNNIQTKYLHLHKRKVKKGQRVKQKQIIGSVGSTGMSTGPHLHYEFLLNGVHRNPRTIVPKLPKANPVPKAERERFFANTKDLVTLLEPSKPELNNGTQIASQEPSDDSPTSM